jgi:hypothetical protein
VAERKEASDGSSLSIGSPPKPDHQSRHFTLTVLFAIKTDVVTQQSSGGQNPARASAFVR